MDYPDELTIRIAGHEILHPPFAMEGPTAKAAIATLEKADPLIVRILKEHDPAFGYNTMEGILNEDTGPRPWTRSSPSSLGVAVPPAKRWASADDGMHVVAAGAATGCSRPRASTGLAGTSKPGWPRPVKAGKLAPASCTPASKVLEVPVDRLWPRKKAD